MNKKQKKWLKRILLALALFFTVMALDELGVLAGIFGEPGALYASFALYLIPYLIAGHDVLLKAWRNIRRGEAFDESFLMAVATIGAFAMIFFPETEPHMAEGAAVMLFYQVGELFQSYAVGKSRKSIAAMMDIAPDYANIERDGAIVEVDPDEVQVGDIIVVKPGERVPIDGVVVDGTSQLDTAALTGESVPRHIEVGGEVISGCINMTGVLRIRTTKLFGTSTVSRILELVENASEKKARTENFITRFARVYTPIVTLAAVAIAVVPPLLGMGAWAGWILRGLTFLVVSCPCALVISVPLSFFGGIGGASRLGILVKGSNHLEALAQVDTVVFDKTGTLTSGTFGVVGVHPADAIDSDQLLAVAAHAEAFSDHPIALSVKKAYLDEAPADSERIIDQARIEGAAEESGHGVKATVDGHAVLVGNDKLMSAHGISCPDCELTGTILHVAIDGAYAGHIVIADTVKDDAAQAIADLHAAGVERCIMLTGDREEVARSVASDLGLDEYHAQLLPGDKVEQVERILDSARGNLAFVGDGINDAPVLTRADVGIAMGAMGSDAAIEAADIVLMDDKPSNIARAIRVARKTMRIVHQNIVFAIGVKLLILALAAVGIANMWLAVFGDVGVAVIAILNAMRAMNVKDC
ncbi:Cadmium, zinc and cobalt-transporting ATPase [Collinsella intestinalis]|uniref:Cadmium, zinc and cobalt-transporting ATPase n=1 Tax=Collinsella intestinalis TaxID=147207 RepID=A0A5K1IQY7_9ACTN|nr:heavy metal translocating P-type ATPase [Collinsella intestinalis]VWL90682.1 Cadmium, zinc and cobalt-transporting ATPase [Collinsella intestinalis]